METKQLGPLKERGMRLERPSPGQHAMKRRQQSCLEAVTRMMAEVGDVLRERLSEISEQMIILVLLLAKVLLPAIIQENWSQVPNSHVMLEAKSSGPTGGISSPREPMRSHRFTSQASHRSHRLPLFLDQSQYHLIIIFPPLAAAFPFQHCTRRLVWGRPFT